MLDLAIKHEAKLQELFNDIALDVKYMFYNGCSYRDKYKADESTWNKHEFASLDTQGNVIGYIKYNIDRDSSVVNNLSIINFTDNKVVFGRDAAQALDEVFTKFNFRKMRYSVYVGNPIENTYDRLTKKCGGRITGINLQDDKLLDGNYYDFKSYEIFREDYIKHKLKGTHESIKTNIQLQTYGRSQHGI